MSPPSPLIRGLSAVTAHRTSAELANGATPSDNPVDLARAESLDVGPPPDGGATAWLNVFSVFLLLFVIFGWTTSFGQLSVYYLHHQLPTYSKSTVAWLGSAQSTICFCGSVPVGRYFDAHGPKLLIRVGTLFTISSLVGIAFSHEFYQFLLGHMLFGIAGTLIYAPATAISGHWFSTRRSTAVGIIVCGGGLGGVVYPIFLKNMFDRFSFRNSILIVTAFNLVLMLPAACGLMKARLPPRRPPPLRALAGPWKDIQYAFLVIGSGMCTLNLFSPYFNAPILATGNTLPKHIADYALAILQAGSFTGRATAGILADRFGVWTVFIASIAGLAISLFGFWTAQLNTAGTIVGLILYGIASGAWFTLAAAACVAISPVREVGMRIGILWASVGIPVLIGPVVCGVLIAKADGKFTPYAGAFCGATMVLATILTPAPRLWQIVQGLLGRRRVTGGEAGVGSEVEKGRALQAEEDVVK